MTDTRSLDGPREAPFLFATRASCFAKWGFDIIGAAIILLLSLPLVALTAVAVALDGGPIFYFGDRVGVNGKIFKCLKFRTMIPDADLCLDEYLEHHPAARDEWRREGRLAFDPRVTMIGKSLRQSGLDELPQLLNVIRGEMSLVGPRPVTPSELEDYYSESSGALYKSVRPGITGLWQVSGPGGLDSADRVELDDRYVRDWNFLLDILILWQTPRVVLSRRGAR